MSPVAKDVVNSPFRENTFSEKGEGSVESNMIPRIAMLFSTFLVLTVLAISQERTVTEATSYDDAEAYRVYSAILPNEWSWHEAKANTLVIRVETASYKMCVEPDKESEKIIGSAIADYKKMNKNQWSLQRQFHITKPYELISGEELDTTFKSGGTAGRYSTNDTRVQAGVLNFLP
jgi:hypothetical protein